MIKDGQVVIRARNLNIGANFIPPPKSFRNEENELLHVPKDQAVQNPLAHMFSDPYMAMEKNLSMIIPQTLTVDVSSGESSYTDTHLPEAMLTEILARLPLRSIFRFKSVCRRWKSTLESVYFRHLFLSLHQNTSSCWSLLCGTKELLNWHGCETWDLPKSLAWYFRDIGIRNRLYYQASCSGLVLMEGSDNASYVGNPILQEWVRIPGPPYPYTTLALHLMTRLNEDAGGVVLGFKIVRMASVVPMRDESSTCMRLCVYSSETGIWTCKRILFPLYFTTLYTCFSLNGTLYLSQTSTELAGRSGALMAHDFYSDSDLGRVIPLPDHDLDHNEQFQRALTVSCGSIMYIKTLVSQMGDSLLKIWRLNRDDCWQLVWEIRLPFKDIRYYAPMAMHPFDRNVVYLWSQENHYLVSCNLGTQNYKILGDNDHQDCFMNQSICETHMDNKYVAPAILHPFVLPRWMESMPCPPQLEMINTTSLLSHISSLPDKGAKNRGK